MKYPSLFAASENLNLTLLTTLVQQLAASIMT
jgi:hypothetical protein